MANCCIEHVLHNYGLWQPRTLQVGSCELKFDYCL